MNKELIMGADIGGSKINIIVWDGKKVVDSRQTNEVNLENLKKGILNFDISKVGIGMAGVLDYKTGCILNSPNLKIFEGICLKKFLNKNVRFNNDVSCFLRVEAAWIGWRIRLHDYRKRKNLGKTLPGNKRQS